MLLFTAILCGGLIMVIEVLGSRVIGPFFGVSLFIWTSLISVAMISLALGYGLGGRFADRFPDPKYLYLIIFIAGVFVLLIPVTKAWVIQFTIPFGLRLGSFTATVLLFGPSLFLLGCVSPYIIKIAAGEMANIGRTVGGFYALSTVGSVIGTAGTGFVLIAWLGIDDIFQLTGGLLIGLATTYFLLQKLYRYSIGLILFPALMIIQPDTDYPTVFTDSGVKVQLLDNVDSHYGNLKVVEYQYQQIRLRELLIDGLVQGGIDQSNGLSVYPYPYFLQLLPLAIKPDIDNALMIGMGAGVISKGLEDNNIVTDVVDIDPEIFLMAQKWFGANPDGDYIVQDARYFLTTSTKQYDLIIFDVFTGDTTPGHLLSQEAMKLISEKMSPDGVLAINLAADLSGHGFMTASIIKTLKSLFDQVEIYPTFEMTDQSQSGNIAVLAYMGKQVTPDLRSVRTANIHSLASKDVYQNIGTTYTIPDNQAAIILSDDYNPIDVYDAEYREQLRKNIIETTPLEILIYSN